MIPTFAVLGALEVCRDGVPVLLPSGRRRPVLAALLVRAGRPVPADALVEAAWGDELPADPRPALHTVLSRLRSVLGDGVLRAGPAGYSIDPGPGGLDADRFEALRGQAAEASAARAAALFDEALALWRGPAYAEFADRDFARPEAVRLNELRLATVEDRAELSLELGQVTAAVTSLDALIAGHPLRERARWLVMTALYQAGRPADALERYHHYRMLLAGELGLAPSPALRDLQARILRHDLAAAPRPARRRVPAAPAWLVTSAAFVGREGETAALLEAVGTHRLVTVTGTGGVGKPRLVAEALGSLTERFGLPATVAELAGATTGQADRALAAALGLGATGSVRAAVLEYLSISAGLLARDPGIRRSSAAALALAAGGLAACDTGELAEAERLGTEALKHAADSAERFLAMLCLGIATLYRGDHDRSLSWCGQIAADTSFPPAHRAEGHATLALLACYGGDLDAASEHAAQARIARGPADTRPSRPTRPAKSPSCRTRRRASRCCGRSRQHRRHPALMIHAAGSPVEVAAAPRSGS